MADEKNGGKLVTPQPQPGVSDDELRKRYPLVVELDEEGEGTATELEKRLRKRVIGQDRAIRRVLRAIIPFEMYMNDPLRPIGAILEAGPPGVGKTLIGKVLAEEWGAVFVKIPGGEYEERHEISRLRGAPPSYVGYSDPGPLDDIGKSAEENLRRVLLLLRNLQQELERQIGGAAYRALQLKYGLDDAVTGIKREAAEIFWPPRVVLLIDEIEKAHVVLQHFLLEVLEDGTVTISRKKDAQGHSAERVAVDFSGTVVVMTTNIGTKEVIGEFFDNHGMGFLDAQGRPRKAPKPPASGHSPTAIAEDLVHSMASLLPSLDAVRTIPDFSVHASSSLGTESSGRTSDEWQKRDQQIWRDVKRRVNDFFIPELLSRIGSEGIVVLQTLPKEDLFKILEIELAEITELFSGRTPHPGPLLISYTGAFKDFLVSESIKPKEGARALRTMIRRFIRGSIALAAQKKLVFHGDSILLDVEWVKESDGERRGRTIIRRMPSTVPLGELKAFPRRPTRPPNLEEYVRNRFSEERQKATTAWLKDTSRNGPDGQGRH